MGISFKTEQTGVLVYREDDDDDYGDYYDGDYDVFFPMPMPRRSRRRSMAYPGRPSSNFVDSNEAFLVSIARPHRTHAVPRCTHRLAA